MNVINLAAVITTGLTLYIQSIVAPTPIITKNGLYPDIDLAIFNSPTPSPTPTMTPTPTNTPTPRPTPTPIPTPYPVSKSDLDGWFESYSSQYGIDRMKLFAIAACETMLKVNAINGPYAGLYQFSASTWKSARTRMGLDFNPDLRFNPEESIRTAAFKISVDGPGAWPVCSKK